MSVVRHEHPHPGDPRPGHAPEPDPEGRRQRRGLSGPYTRGVSDSGLSLSIHDPGRQGLDATPILDGAAPQAIYAHVPFCRHKCHYCDFYSLVDQRGRIELFADRFEREAEAVAGLVDAGSIRTAFVGGGTPTLLPAADLQRVLAAIRRLAGDRLEEFTVEANPETVTDEIAAAIVAGGVDRTSIGCQSFDPRHLTTLERHHDPASVPRAVARLRAAGIRRLNLDLIFGIPGSTLEDWRRDLDAALALEPDHLSCYGLVFEPGTPLAEKQRLGRIDAIDDEIEAAMYDLVRDRLREAGFEHYEISNWCRPGEACRHNLVYWTAGEWVALGPAAAGSLRGVRYRHRPRLDDWLEESGVTRAIDVDRPDADTARGETLMLGLRLRSGMRRSVVEPLLAEDDRRRSLVGGHLDAGRLEWRDDHLRIADDAVMMADSVLSDLV